MFKLMKFYSLALLAGFTFYQLLPVVCLADGIDPNEIPITSPSASSEALQLFLSGREAFDMGRLNDANNLLDKAIEKDPQFASAYLYKAYSASTDLEWSTFLGQAVISRNLVSEGEKILIDMESALSARISEKRLGLAKRLVELYPLSSRAQLILAGEYQIRKEFTKFRELAHYAIRLNPLSPLAYRTVASSYLLNEPLDFALALKYMERFVELRPNEATAYVALGDVHRARLSFDRAIIAFTKAIRLDPKNDLAWSKRGYINTYQGFFEDARKDWETSLNLAKENSLINLPNNNLISYLFSGNGKIQETGPAVTIAEKSRRKSAKDQMESPEDDHYFCCTVISMKHGVYVSPFQTMNECRALQREFTKEAKAPEPVMIAANIAFIESVHSILLGDFEKAKQKADEHARMVEPFKSPGKLQVYNYLMGLIDLKQEHYGQAVAHYMKSDLNNACVKYELGLAYDGLGEWEKAQEMFNAVSNCNFATAAEPRMIRISNKWLKTYAALPKEE
jgi:tetratricopeptide (TPR) repeat protein